MNRVTVSFNSHQALSYHDEGSHTVLRQATDNARANTWAGRLRTTVEDVPSDDEGEQSNIGNQPDSAAFQTDEDVGDDDGKAFWNEYVDECLAAEEAGSRDEDDREIGLSAWDQLGVEFEAENRPTCVYQIDSIDATLLMVCADESLSESDKATL